MFIFLAHVGAAYVGDLDLENETQAFVFDTLKVSFYAVVVNITLSGQSNYMYYFQSSQIP